MERGGNGAPMGYRKLVDQTPYNLGALDGDGNYHRPDQLVRSRDPFDPEGWAERNRRIDASRTRNNPPLTAAAD